MNKTRTIMVFAALGGLFALSACDSSTTTGTDAGTPPVDTGTPMVDTGTPEVDAGPMMVDAGPMMVDAGPPDAGPPEPIKFAVRLVNMIAGLTPIATVAPGGAVDVCLYIAGSTTYLTSTNKIPYGGVSPYLPFLYGVPYTFRVYDAATFGRTDCPAMSDTSHILEQVVSPTDVTLGEYHSVIATGATAAFCAANSIPTAACPAIQIAVHVDDLTEPASGMIRIRGASGLILPPGTVPTIDICYSAGGTGAPEALASNIAPRGMSDFVEDMPVTAAGLITVNVANATACSGTMIGSFPVGSVPTSAALTAASTSIPATYAADHNYTLFIFPVGNSASPPASLAAPFLVPWTDPPADPGIFL